MSRKKRVPRTSLHAHRWKQLKQLLRDLSYNTNAEQIRIEWFLTLYKENKWRCKAHHRRFCRLQLWKLLYKRQSVLQFWYSEKFDYCNQFQKLSLPIFYQWFNILQHQKNNTLKKSYKFFQCLKAGMSSTEWKKIHQICCHLWTDFESTHPYVSSGVKTVSKGSYQIALRGNITV